MEFGLLRPWIFQVVVDENKKTTPKSGLNSCCVALPGIEPGSGASETHILSIVLQGQVCKSN
jgi:hypothetical protein